jgi:phospholipid transport system substrate-binding protein
MNNLSKSVKALAFSFIVIFTTVFTVSAFAGSDPVAELNSIANQLISELKENKTNLHDNPTLVYSLANRIVVPHADITGMSRSVMPPRIWNGASSSQKSQFETEFTNLLVHTYASALANYNDQTVKFFPVRGGYTGKGSVQVSSLIERPDGPPISVKYKMVASGSGWKIYDMSVEGISMLESFRSQFADQLSHGDMDALLQKLSSHNTGG